MEKTTKEDKKQKLILGNKPQEEVDTFEENLDSDELLLGEFGSSETNVKIDEDKTNKKSDKKLIKG